MVSEQCKAQGIEQNDYRFSRKEIRDFTGWSDGQLKIHCTRLSELEYLLVHRGGRGCSLVYELLYTCNVDSDESQLIGLIDTKQLKKEQYDEQKSGQKTEKLAPSQGQVRAKSDLEKSIKLNGHAGLQESSQTNQKNASLVL